MTDEMLELARANAAEAGVENVDWLKGHIEAIPLPDAQRRRRHLQLRDQPSADKPQRAARGRARAASPAGRFAVSDVIADPDMDEATRADMAAVRGCIAGALTRDEFEHPLADAGLTEIEITETHRVHEHAGSAIIRAGLARLVRTRERVCGFRR